MTRSAMFAFSAHSPRLQGGAARILLAFAGSQGERGWSAVGAISRSAIRARHTKYQSPPMIHFDQTLRSGVRGRRLTLKRQRRQRHVRSSYQCGLAGVAAFVNTFLKQTFRPPECHLRIFPGILMQDRSNGAMS